MSFVFPLQQFTQVISLRGFFGPHQHNLLSIYETIVSLLQHLVFLI